MRKGGDHFIISWSGDGDWGAMGASGRRVSRERTVSEGGQWLQTIGLPFGVRVDYNLEIKKKWARSGDTERAPTNVTELVDYLLRRAKRESVICFG